VVVDLWWRPECDGQRWWPTTTGWRTGRLVAEVRVSSSFFVFLFFVGKKDKREIKGKLGQKTLVRKGFAAVRIKGSDTNLM